MILFNLSKYNPHVLNLNSYLIKPPLLYNKMHNVVIHFDKDNGIRESNGVTFLHVYRKGTYAYYHKAKQRLMFLEKIIYNNII